MTDAERAQRERLAMRRRGWWEGGPLPDGENGSELARALVRLYVGPPGRVVEAYGFRFWSRRTLGSPGYVAAESRGARRQSDGSLVGAAHSW